MQESYIISQLNYNTRFFKKNASVNPILLQVKADSQI